ncbi:Ras- protein Rab-23 [Borealophlyctis nickersoniae]|nr:Ras- protein Rab-23 [Borealophlyctis nickersoniae]
MASSLTTEDVDPAVKILVVGNGSIGKSTMIRRFCKGHYEENYKKTIGVAYVEREIEVPEFGSVRLMLWDTAGQEEFDAMTREYYKDTDAVVLAFSSTDRLSFETIKAWRDKVTAVCDDLAMVLVQNKIDLLHEALVSQYVEIIMILPFMMLLHPVVVLIDEGESFPERKQRV